MDFSFRQRLAREYERGIKALFSRIFQHIQGLTAEQAVKYLSVIGHHPEVEKIAENLASRMITAVRADNAKTWRQAARKGTLSRQIRENLSREMQSHIGVDIRNLVEENSKLITSVPADLARQISRETLDMYLKGERWEDEVQRILARAPQLSMSRAKLIARTETSKANAAVTEMRAREIGSNWYFWRSSHDERVRHSHEMMDGVLCCFDHPPDPELFYGGKSSFGHYHAGCCPNCRCYEEPVVDEDDIPPGCRVCVEGAKPKYMTRAQILELIGFQTA